MMTKYLTVVAGAALVCGLSAQDAPKPLEFDAASVKPSEQAVPAAVGRGTFSFYSGCSGGPGSTDPGRFTCTAVSLRTLIQRGWNLRNYQLAAPGALDDAKYDVVAKVPDGTNKEQFDQMLQKLLTDRFHLTMHHEKREQQVFTLSVGKDGHKLQAPQPGDTESPRDALTNNPNGDGKAKKKDPLDNPDADSQTAPMIEGLRGQLAAMRASRAGRAGAPAPAHIASSSTNGVTRLAGRRATMADLTRFLSNELGRPVVDHTQLTGEWNFLVEYASNGSRGDNAAARAMSSLRQSLPEPDPARSSTEPSGAPSITNAFQKQLGLRLEVAKEPADTVVVDKFDKTPAAN